MLREYLYNSKGTLLELPKELQLKSGDIVLRRETNHISDIFAHLNESEYSHIGTILFIGGKANVVHMEDEDSEEDFHITPLGSFLQYAAKYAIYRPKHQIDEKKLYRDVRKIQSQHPKFDMEFSSKEDNAIYCTELAYILNKDASAFDISPKLKKYMNYRFISVEEFVDKRYFSLLYRSF